MNMPNDLKLWKYGAFPGNACDFSDAERAGFEMAVRKHCHLDQDEEVQMERYYRCCKVHYLRTLTRVRRNAALIEPAREHEFYNAAKQLLQQ